MNFFIERFRGRKLTKQAQIHVFTQGQDPKNHIRVCETEWRRLGYKDERIWPHLFPSTLDDLPKKWYKMEEARGEKFLWNELIENFIKDFSFISEDEKLVEATKQIKTFIKPTTNNSTQNNIRPNTTCHNIRSNKIPQLMRLQLENKHTHGKSFQWKSDHLEMIKPVKTILKIE